MGVLSVVQEIEKQALFRFDLVNVFSFLFQAKSETTQGELSFVFPATWSQEKVSCKKKEETHFDNWSKVVWKEMLAKLVAMIRPFVLPSLSLPVDG